MTETVTRCPQCATAFKITSAQLQTAKGAVRCGSCLQVFMAHDHMVEDAKVLAPADQDEQQDFCIDQYQQEVFSEIEASQTSEPSEERYNDDEPQADSAYQQNSDVEALQPAFQSEDNPHVGEVDDEAWAQDILNELENEDKQQQEHEHDNETQLPGFEPDEDNNQYDAEHRLEDHISSLDLDDEPEQALPEEEDELNPEQPLSDEILEEAELSLESLADDDNCHQELDNKEQLLENIEPEPVEFEYQTSGVNWRWLWGLASILALLTIGAQFAYSKFEPYNRIDPYRQWYAKACVLLKCTLPPQHDLSKIKLYNLVVRSHSDTAEALSVDMIILNTAIYQQNFPDIQLSFSDENNKTVASRDFTAKEYLAGELAGRKLIPIQQPIHLSLNILDPGESAINYQVEAKAPAP